LINSKFIKLKTIIVPPTVFLEKLLASNYLMLIKHFPLPKLFYILTGWKLTKILLTLLQKPWNYLWDKFKKILEHPLLNKPWLLDILPKLNGRVSNLKMNCPMKMEPQTNAAFIFLLKLLFLRMETIILSFALTWLNLKLRMDNLAKLLLKHGLLKLMEMLIDFKFLMITTIWAKMSKKSLVILEKLLLNSTP